MADQVQIIRKQTIISTKPVKPGKVCNLSVLDRVMEHNHIRLVLYYQTPIGKKYGEVSRKLKESISDTLSDFPLVLGRLMRDHEGQWKIKCNDAGLRLVEAKVNGTVGEWLRNVDRDKEFKLVHREEMFENPYLWSSFNVQITEFEGGGLAIGLSCTHLISDPISATKLIKAWADTTLTGKMTSPPFFNPLPPRRPGKVNTDHKPNLELINQYKTTLQNNSPSTCSKTISFLFTEEMVRTCVSLAGVGRTSFEALSAVFWLCISRINGEGSALVDMTICLDMRKVLGLDSCFFGNCMVYKNVKGDVHNVSDASIAINEEVSKMNYDGVMDFIEWLEKENCVNSSCVNGDRLVCANLENVGVYSAFFENNGNMLRASYYIEPAVGLGQVLILPAPSGEHVSGRVVMVTLPEGEAERILDDPLIKQISPTILMGMIK